MENTSASRGGCERGVSTALPNITSELQSRTTKAVLQLSPSKLRRFFRVKGNAYAGMLKQVV